MAVDQYKTNHPDELLLDFGCKPPSPICPVDSRPDLWQHDIDNIFDGCFINQGAPLSNLSAYQYDTSPQVLDSPFVNSDSRFTLASEGPSSPTDLGRNLAYTPTQLTPITPRAPPSKSRRYPIERWNQMKPLLQSLYIDQGISLSEARRILEEEHSFVASEKQYKSKLKLWGLKKYTSRIADQPRPT